VANELSYMCEECGLDSFIHQVATTAGLKCCCDSAGADTNDCAQKRELNGKLRAVKADVNTDLAENMPPPSRKISSISGPAVPTQTATPFAMRRRLQLR
jgi:hypothetical protein